MKIIDTHSHIYLKEFAHDLPLVIERAKVAGVSRILLPNIDTTTVEDMLGLCERYPGYCYPMIGLHPTSVNASYKEEMHLLEERLKSPNNYIAIGEVGLDLYWDKTYEEEQLRVFDQQIKWALAYDLPLVIHCREACQQLYSALLPYKGSALSGVFHSFTGTEEEATRLLEFERFKLGINGVLTFKKSTLSQVLQQVPLERILLETDAPYLTPVPYRGKRNESGYLKYTLLKLAEVYGLPPEKVAEVTLRNTLELFTKLK